MSNKVQIYVYDITQGMAKILSPGLIGKQIDLIPHTGVVVFGKEYFFGGGVVIHPSPGNAIPMKPVQILDIGVSKKSESELNTFLKDKMMSKYTQETYNLLKHNCNHFANEVALFLTENEKGVPESIVNIADEALSTPQGQQLRVVIEQFESNMRQQNSGGSALNPFGSTTGDSSSSNSTAAPSATAAAATNTTTSSSTSTSTSSVDPGTPSIPGSTELSAALKEILTNDTVDKKRNCLSTLSKMITNIVEKGAVPESEEAQKFRKIKMDNKAFNSKVAEVNGGTEAILALGFAPDNIDGVDYWVWKEGNTCGSIEDLKNVLLVQLKKELDKLPAPVTTAPTPTSTTMPNPATTTNPLLNNFGQGLGGPEGGCLPGGGMGGMGGLPGMPPGGLNSQSMQQMMNNPQIQQMMNNPQMMQQAQQMMNNPQMMQQMMNMMNQGGFR